ncbi:MAG: prolipoprotein diacylglyceryl transferase, partial [Clostridia bacterium]|nr:prolipoprotein diacylglyceryl transferase [Clostridia bacterium]
NIRDGGLAIYGGVAGGALGIFIVCRIKKISVFKVFDFGATMLPLGQAIGRWGNFFNQEVYGQEITNPSLQFFPLAVEIEKNGTVGWYQALFFYESILNLALFVFLYLFIMKRKGQTNGYSVGYYFIGYGLIRGILENFRQSEYNLPLFGLDIKGMVIVSVLLVIAGAAIIAICLFKDKKFGKKPITRQ